jgi:hypothetical protein
MPKEIFMEKTIAVPAKYPGSEELSVTGPMCCKGCHLVYGSEECDAKIFGPGCSSRDREDGVEVVWRNPCTR